MKLTRHDIVVVGGGPVGAAAALALAQAGFDVALVERGAAPGGFNAASYAARVYALSPATMRFLTRLGVWPAIATARISPYRAMQVWVDAPEQGLRFHASQVGLTELGWIVEHPLLTHVLWSALPTAGVEILSDRGDVTWHAGESGAGSLRLADGSSLQADLVVAADGVNSSLRRAAGIETLGWQYAQRGIVCNLRTEKSHRATAWQRFLPTGPLALLPLADGRSSLVWSVDERRASELLKLKDAAFSETLAAALQIFGKISEVTPRLDFPLRLLHAVDYGRPGLVLVGDAAHSVHPLAGQGVNLGLADIADLCRVLEEARRAGREWAGMRSVRRYTRSRKGDNIEMLALTDTLQRAFHSPRPGVRQLLGRGMQVVDGFGPMKAWLANQATVPAAATAQGHPSPTRRSMRGIG